MGEYTAAGLPFEPAPTGAASGMTFWWALVLLDVVVLGWAIALARVDIREHRLPRKLTLPAYPVMALVCAAAWLGAGALAVGEAGQVRARVLTAFVGAVGMRVVYRLARFFSPGGSALGRGDVTLSTPLGAWLGLHGSDALWWGAWAGFAVTGLAAVALLVTRRANRHTHLPHGPGMLAGAALAVAVLGW